MMLQGKMLDQKVVKMTDISLSIVVPHYNSPKTLIKLLNSIFDENVNDIEVIVVDDKSNKYLDEYDECIKLFEKKQVYFLKNNTEKKGAGVCRNIGLDNLSGEWILFADADDYLLKGWYECVKKHFESNDDVIFFYPTSLNLQTNQRGKREQTYINVLDKYVTGEKGAEYWVRYYFNVPWSKMIKKELIETYGIRFDCTQYANDVMFSAKVGYNMRSFQIDKGSIYCVTEGEDSLTTKKSEEVNLIRTQVFTDRYIYLKERLSKEQWDMLPVKNEPLRRLYRVVQRKYGLKALLKYIRLFRSKKIPIITRDTLLILFKGK